VPVPGRQRARLGLRRLLRPPVGHQRLGRAAGPGHRVFYKVTQPHDCGSTCFRRRRRRRGVRAR
jgi:hypothetical protein